MHGALLLRERYSVRGKKEGLLKALIGAPAYKLLGSLIALDKPVDKTYTKLVTVMKQRYCSKMAVVVQRFKYNSRVRQERASQSTSHN